MKIVLTGGGTGGHFYPVIAVAEALRVYAKEKNISNLELYYLAPEPYSADLLREHTITFVQIPAGKLRRYFSIANITDLFKTGWGLVKAFWKMFWIYPDVVFAKGGYVSFPIIIAAWILRIPIVIHESDTVPGRLNAWAGSIARRVAISYPEAAEYFPKDKVALTGNPIRTSITKLSREGSHEFFKLSDSIPIILVWGGSQGAQIINENILNSLPALVEKYQIIHQVGQNNLKYVQETAQVVLFENPHKDRYKIYDHLNDEALKRAASITEIYVSRAGSAIFEIAVWGIPAIIIPITDSNGDHQRKNAYSYARTGAAVVIEENNLSPHVLLSEIDRLAGDATVRNKMKEAARNFAKINAAERIAQEIINLALTH